MAILNHPQIFGGFFCVNLRNNQFSVSLLGTVVNRTSHSLDVESLKISTTVLLVVPGFGNVNVFYYVETINYSGGVLCNTVGLFDHN